MPEQSNDYRVVVFGAGGVGKSSLVLRFITDTTGSHQFPAMQRLSISKGHAFILVFSHRNIPVMLVGNKCDETQREVDTKEVEALAKEWKCAFMETSAKMNYNVKELFQELLNLEKRRNIDLNIDGKRMKSVGKTKYCERR
ncbi:hypothetical protein GDO86_000980 [Hymenochirus boettgeri]|uniref:Small monomeric GTPase n=1 Tax=Hymenochirus boettgeri TaxID=247094 RepID=A0A8T2KFB2_9PIPI|nr:hypothetical protein GDO86_000980 [Hymenochirus boettgeri]